MTQADVMNAIIAAIDRGEYRYGDRLPPTRELANQLGTTQQTVAAAMTVMAGMGLVEVQRGWGARIVAGRPSRIRLGRYRSANREVPTGTTAWKRDTGTEAARETPANVRQATASEEDADTGIPTGADIVERTRVRFIDDVPVQHKRTLLTVESAMLAPEGWTGLPPMMRPEDVPPPDGQSIAQWLGMGVVNVAYDIFVAPASADAAQALTVAPGTSCFRIVSKGLKEDGSTAYATITTASLRSRIGLDITQ